MAWKVSLISAFLLLFVVLTSGLVSAVPVKMDLSGTEITATSEEVRLEDGRAVNISDGNLDTIWHSQYTDPAGKLPHRIRIGFNATKTLASFVYWPRQGGTNGNMRRYNVYVHDTTGDLGVPESGVRPDALKKDSFTHIFKTPLTGRYMTLEITEAEPVGKPWGNMAEIDIYESDSLVVIPSASIGGVMIIWDYVRSDATKMTDLSFNLRWGPNSRGTITRPDGNGNRRTSPYANILTIPVNKFQYEFKFFDGSSQCMSITTVAQGVADGVVYESDFSNEICLPSMVKNIKVENR